MQRYAIFAGVALCLAAFALQSSRQDDCCRFPGVAVAFAQEATAEVSAPPSEGTEATPSSQQEAKTAPAEGGPQGLPSEQAQDTPPAVEGTPPSTPQEQPAAAQVGTEAPVPAAAQPPEAQARVAQPAEAALKGQPEEPPRPNLAEILAKLRPQDPEKYRKIGEISQVKIHRIETLHGLGLVVDLAEFAKALGSPARSGGVPSSALGTVLGASPTATPSPGGLRTPASPAADVRALLQLLEQKISADDPTALVPEVLWERRAVTLVSVTVTVPPEGARKGDRLDCQVRSFEPRSIAGGYLLPTKLFPPGPREGQPVGIAAGPIVSDSALRTAGDKVIGGCLVQTDITEQFLQDGKIRLLLRSEHADFLVAQDIADRINVELGLLAGKPLAKAIGPGAVEVELPPAFEDNPVGFVSQLLRLPSSVPIEEPPTPSPGRSLLPRPSR